MGNIKHILRLSIKYFLEILFPSYCIECNRRGEILCDDCINCIKLTERETENGILALFDYRDLIIKNAIWKLKYHKTRYLGEKLGIILYESFIEEIEDLKMFSLGSPIGVIPVPISKDRKYERGYNQTEIIAKSFCNSVTSSDFQLLNNVIYKKINNIPQAKLTNRNKRLKNVIGVFDIKNSELIRNKTIIVIDDVTTTGGTMLEIIKILKKRGAKKVVGLAIAH